MQITARTFGVAVAGLTLAGVSTGCSSETEMIQALESDVPTEELVGETMTVTSEVQATLVPGVFTVGPRDTIVLAQQFPEDLTVGDEVEVMGTVDSRDVFTMDDREDLMGVTSPHIASYLVNRDEELVLVDAQVTRAS